MTHHSSVLAWRIPRAEELGGLQSHRVAKSQTQQSNQAQHSGLHTIFYICFSVPVCVGVGVGVGVSHSVMFDCLQPYGLKPTRPLCPRNFPGKNIGVSSHSLLQGILLTQGLNPDLLYTHTHTYITESLCYIFEINTKLQINYT